MLRGFLFLGIKEMNFSFSKTLQPTFFHFKNVKCNIKISQLILSVL